MLFGEKCGNKNFTNTLKSYMINRLLRLHSCEFLHLLSKININKYSDGKPLTV